MGAPLVRSPLPLTHPHSHNHRTLPVLAVPGVERAKMAEKLGEDTPTH